MLRDGRTQWFTSGILHLVFFLPQWLSPLQTIKKTTPVSSREKIHCFGAPRGGSDCVMHCLLFFSPNLSLSSLLLPAPTLLLPPLPAFHSLFFPSPPPFSPSSFLPSSPCLPFLLFLLSLPATLARSGQRSSHDMPAVPKESATLGKRKRERED